jgi:hypothetical protein
MEQLERIAEITISKHCQTLKWKRDSKTLYKLLGKNGKPIGQPFEKNKNAFKKHLALGNAMIKLAKDEKKGDNKKYSCALDAFLTPCHKNCGKKFCAYDKLRSQGHSIPKSSSEAILFALSNKSLWDCFTKENNYAPTKVVIKLLQNNFDFMTRLKNLVPKKTPWIPIIPLPLPIDFSMRNYCTDLIVYKSNFTNRETLQSTVNLTDLVAYQPIGNHSTHLVVYEPFSNIPANFLNTPPYFPIIFTILFMFFIRFLQRSKFV